MLVRARAWGFVRTGRTNGRFGVRVAEFGTGGSYANPLDNDVDAGDAAAGVEFCPVFATPPSSGNFSASTDGSLALTGAADGIYVIPYTLHTFTPGASTSVNRGSTSATVSVGNVGITLSPTPAVLTLTGNAPVVTQPVQLAPGQAAITVAGLAPTLGQPVTVQPGVAALTVVGLVPDVTQVSGLAPGACALVVMGLAPQIGQPHAVAPGQASIVLTGWAALIDQAAPGTQWRPGKRVVALPAVGQLCRTIYLHAM